MEAGLTTQAGHVPPFRQKQVRVRQCSQSVPRLRRTSALRRGAGSTLCVSRSDPPLRRRRASRQLPDSRRRDRSSVVSRRRLAFSVPCLRSSLRPRGATSVGSICAQRARDRQPAAEWGQLRPSHPGGVGVSAISCRLSQLRSSFPRLSAGHRGKQQVRNHRCERHRKRNTGSPGMAESRKAYNECRSDDSGHREAPELNRPLPSSERAGPSSTGLACLIAPVVVAELRCHEQTCGWQKYGHDRGYREAETLCAAKTLAVPAVQLLPSNDIDIDSICDWRQSYGVCSRCGRTRERYRVWLTSPAR
jgi:hypothetical protein